MGGQSYNSGGGGAGYLCLSNVPQYLQVTAGSQGASLIYRTEYETAAARLTATWTALQNWEAPCVVCQAPTGRGYRYLSLSLAILFNTSRSFMQPGKANCPSGFGTDYQ